MVVLFNNGCSIEISPGDSTYVGSTVGSGLVLEVLAHPERNILATSSTFVYFRIWNPVTDMVSSGLSRNHHVLADSANANQVYRTQCPSTRTDCTWREKNETNKLHDCVRIPQEELVGPLQNGVEETPRWRGTLVPACTSWADILVHVDRGLSVLQDFSPSVGAHRHHGHPHEHRNLKANHGLASKSEEFTVVVRQPKRPGNAGTL